MDCILPDGFVSEIGMIFDRVKVGELTGKQQNYLLDVKTLQSGIAHIDKLLEDLVQSIYSEDGTVFQGNKKDAINRLSSNDLEAILIKIRENTFGNIYLFKANCDHCDAENEIKIDLSTLEVKRSPKEEKGKCLDVVLPRSQKKAQLKLMGLESLHRSFIMFQKSRSELVTTTAAMVLKSLDGKENPQPKDLDNLPVLDIKFINDEYDKLGGRVDTTITHQCKKCEQDFDTKLNVISPNFYSLG